MESRGGSAAPADNKPADERTCTAAPKALAFYLPQFHPIPENDEWWGKGFTEWHNVTRAKPLFPGHYQPHLPSELGFYDLRLPEIRSAQAELARSHGVHGFVYYHYWFQGRRLLERPFNEVLASGEPDFPFVLCWANEAWTRGWDSQTGHILVEQHYSHEDDLNHIRALLPAFADPRYIKIDGRPLMLIYRPALLPDLKRTTDIWRDQAQKAGFPDLYLCWVESWNRPPRAPTTLGMDSSCGFMPLDGKQIHAPLSTLRGHRVMDYVSAFEAELERPAVAWKRFPSVMVGWDNTPRRARAATIFENATPDNYARWLRHVADSVADVRDEENFIFILAWNEWAEGNHLEPDQRYGRGYLEATRSVLLDPYRAGSPKDQVSGRPIELGRTTTNADGSQPTLSASQAEAISQALSLVGDLGIAPGRSVVDIDLGLDNHPHVCHELKARGFSALSCEVGDPSALKVALDGLPSRVGALLLLDAVAGVSEPHELLCALSRWSIEHGRPPLVICAPHVAHVDAAIGLLCGRWHPWGHVVSGTGNLRQFTEQTLRRLAERCGWNVVTRADVQTLRSDQHDEALRDGLPEELVGALMSTAQACNPNWSVEHFVWLLEPVPVATKPASYLDAVEPSPDEAESQIPPEATRAIAGYLESVGIVASEVNRRAALATHGHLWPPRMSLAKRIVLKVAYSTPRTEAAFRRIYSKLG